MRCQILQDKWTPANNVCLIDCELTTHLRVGIAWFKRELSQDFIVCKSENGDIINVVVPTDVKNQSTSIIQLNITLEFDYV